MNISIIIPNYNGLELLKKNLSSVSDAVEYYLKKEEGKIEIMVIDDHSSDGSIKYLKDRLEAKKEKNKFMVIENVKNLGFGSTVNKAVDLVNGDVVILLNTDVSPALTFISPLVNHFKDDLVFAVGCMDKSVEGHKTILRGRGLGDWKRGFLVHRRGEVDSAKTLWVNGGSGAFKRLIWNKLGGFDSLYNPFYYEDIDLSYRALKSGYKILFEPQSIVIHDHQAGSINSQFTSQQIKRIAYRNQFIFAWINATDFDLIVKHILWLPYHFIKSLFSGDINFMTGFFYAFVLLPKIIESNRKYRLAYIKKDREVIKIAE